MKARPSNSSRCDARVHRPSDTRSGMGAAWSSSDVKLDFQNNSLAFFKVAGSLPCNSSTALPNSCRDSLQGPSHGRV